MAWKLEMHAAGQAVAIAISGMKVWKEISSGAMLLIEYRWT